MSKNMAHQPTDIKKLCHIQGMEDIKAMSDDDVTTIILAGCSMIDKETKYKVYAIIFEAFLNTPSCLEQYLETLKARPNEDAPVEEKLAYYKNKLREEGLR